MNKLRISDLSYCIDRPILSNISFDVCAGEVVCLLGPSGCGKTTLLRLIAGLETTTSGAIMFDHQILSEPAKNIHMPPELRHVGMVFQDYALFPHLTVLQNIGFGCRNDSAKVNECLQSVGLSAYGKKYPHELSGGERQRVALARAIATDPKILLLDEPFSSLDVVLRQQLREQTLSILKKRNTPVILVTHDPQEAMALGDKIVLLNSGRITQQGSPLQVYTGPADPFVASFLQPCNEWAMSFEEVVGLLGLDGVILPPMADSFKTKSSALSATFEPSCFRAPPDASAPCKVCVRPDDVVLLGTASTEDMNESNPVDKQQKSRSHKGTVDQIQFLGSTLLLLIAARELGLVRAHVSTALGKALRIGDEVTFLVSKGFVFPVSDVTD